MKVFSQNELKLSTYMDMYMQHKGIDMYMYMYVSKIVIKIKVVLEPIFGQTCTVVVTENLAMHFDKNHRLVYMYMYMYM